MVVVNLFLQFFSSIFKLFPYIKAGNQEFGREMDGSESVAQ
jgi:hypothetical protein